MEDFITELKGVKNEVTALWQRFLKLESRAPIDNTALIASQHQRILQLENQVKIYDAVFKSHSKEITDLKAGLDALLVQSHEYDNRPVQVQPKFKWPWK